MRFLQVFCVPFCLFLPGVLRISGYWHFVVGWVVCVVRLCAFMCVFFSSFSFVVCSCYLVSFVGLNVMYPPLSLTLLLVDAMGDCLVWFLLFGLCLLLYLLPLPRR